MSMSIRLVALFAVALSMVGLTGCGEPEVQKESVEQSAMKMLSASVGKAAPPVTCPGNLKAKVGATLTCAMDIDGKTHDVTVNVTSVDGKTANFDVAVAEKPRS